jgi:hypothetical protein
MSVVKQMWKSHACMTATYKQYDLHTPQRNEKGTVLLNMIHKTEGKIPAVGLETTEVDHQCGCKRVNQHWMKYLF